jgi:hypothetical protein
MSAANDNGLMANNDVMKQYEPTNDNNDNNMATNKRNNPIIMKRNGMTV